MSKLRRVVALATLGGVTLAASIAYAAIRDGGPEVHACYKRPGGQLRLGTACNKHELPVTWSQIGPRGPVGGTGPTGPTGPQGNDGSPAPELIGGGTSDGLNGQTRYYGIGGQFGVREATAESVLASSGTLRNLYVKGSNDTAAPATADLTFTVRKNGADTGVTCTMPGTSLPAFTVGICSDTVHSVTFASGDTLSISVVETGTLPGVSVSWTAQYIR